MSSNNNGWGKWMRNGRLSTLVWGMTFIAWLSFKVAEVPLEGLDTVFVIMSGMMAANLGISTIKPGDKTKADDTDA